MNKIIALAFVAFVALSSVAKAQDATATATAVPAWNDVLRTCSEEYKARTDKTKGREIWQAFVNECKARKGFVSKRDQKKTDFVRVPDKS